MSEKPKKTTRKKRVVKIKENDLTKSQDFLSTLDKFIKSKPAKKDKIE